MSGTDRSVLVLYGSETGNAQDIADELGRLCQRLRFMCDVDELDAIDLGALLKYQLVIFVVSTTGQGDLPRNALGFWRKLLRKKLPPGCLSQLKYTCFGLGDSTYIKFNWAARKLTKRLDQLGAGSFIDGFEADEQYDDGIEGCYAHWSDGLRKHLLEHFPHPEGLEPIPEDGLLPPRWSLEPAFAMLQTSSKEDAAASTSTNSNGTQPESPPDTILPIPRGWTATLVDCQRVTPESHWQDVRHVSFDIPHRPDTNESLTVNPGDCLTIFPKSFPQDVQKLIELMGWSKIADVPLDLTSCTLPRALFAPEPSACTLRSLLLNNIDITAVPRRSFLKAISHFSDDAYHRERLLEFTETQYLDEYFDYATRSRRSIIEVLEEFDSVRIPPERLLDVFPLIRGRDFSIANGGRQLLHPTGDPGAVRVELLVAMVRYQTVLRRPREGLCSRYLRALAPRTLLRVGHKPVQSPIHGAVNAKRPLVAIATGTGIAPARSLINERLTHCSNQEPDRALSPPTMALCFGNRNQAADFFFREEWTSLSSQSSPPTPDRNPVLQLQTAFSRDQREKIYVQDLLRRPDVKPMIAELLKQECIFVVCGGSSKMAESCKVAVLEALEDGEEDGGKNGEVNGKLAKELPPGVTWWQEIW